MKSARQRSLSATRTMTNTVNFVGRIGQSLRISSKNAIKRLDSADTPPPSSWKTRLDRSKSAVCHRTFPSKSFDSSESVLLAAGTAIETGIGDDENCTAGELIQYQSNSHALVLTQKSFYSAQILSAPSSCPGTPQMIRRRYMKEGATQLTSLSTLITHHRYLFLFNDLLLVSKQKGANSYKLKQKINLERLWVSSNNCSHSFLIGWPVCNYVAHFNSEAEKDDWYMKLSDCIRKRFKHKSTTVSVAVKIEGRQQNIRKEVFNGQSGSVLLAELIQDLDLSPADSLFYELVFEPTSLTNSGQQLHGIENVYAILMDHIAQSGIQISETQMAHLDTCPLVHCRFVLRNATNSKPSTALNLMSQVLKVLSRSQTKCIFGKELEGSMPNQVVLTMIDHLMIHGTQIEGIFRKSPKRETIRMLRTQIDNGQVPDFHQYNAHVTALLLKDYLRSIPGQLLLIGNIHLWMEAADEKDENKKIKICKNLLKLLPQCHTVLLKNVLRLLRKVVANEMTSKMNAHNLGICLGPSFLDRLDHPESVGRVADVVSFLIKHATELFDGFDDENGGGLLSTQHLETSQPLRLHQSTDSGLSTDEPIDSIPRSSVSPDSALFDSPMSESSVDDDGKIDGPRIEEIETIPTPPNSKERTPVLSRENSDVYNFPHRYQWRSHLSADAATNGPRLTRQEAFRQVVSTQSSISSQDNENIQASLEDEIRVLRLPAEPTDNFPNVDDLRISDIIISHRKKESSDSTKTLIGRTDSTGFSSKSSEYSGKLSTISSLDGRSTVSSSGSAYVSPFNSSSSSSNGRYHGTSTEKTKTVPVNLQSPKSTKRALLTKSNTLGVHQNSVTTTTSTILTPFHRTQKIPTSHGSLDRPEKTLNSTPAPPRVPLTRDSAIHLQGSLDRKVPYRPPKKTAEEIVLDSSLEVNWSVPHIRSFFQTKDSKPAKIDTVYATLESLKKPLESSR